MTDAKLCHMCWEKDKPGTVYVHNRGPFDRIQCCGDCLARADKPWRITVAIDRLLCCGRCLFPVIGVCYSCNKWCIARYRLRMMCGSPEGGFLAGWPLCRQCYSMASELSKHQLVNDLL